MPRRVLWFIFNLWIKKWVSHWHEHTSLQSLHTMISCQHCSIRVHPCSSLKAYWVFLFTMWLRVAWTAFPCWWLGHNSSTDLPSELPAELLSAPLVGVRWGGLIPPLQPLYDGPYAVLHCGPRSFTIRVGSRDEVVTVSRLKACTAADATPGSPCCRGTPPGPHPGSPAATKWVSFSDPLVSSPSFPTPPRDGPRTVFLPGEKVFACPEPAAPSQVPQTRYPSRQRALPQRLDLWPLLLPAKARAQGEPCGNLPTSLLTVYPVGCTPPPLYSTCIWAAIYHTINQCCRTCCAYFHSFNFFCLTLYTQGANFVPILLKFLPKIPCIFLRTLCSWHFFPLLKGYGMKCEF